MDIRPTFITDPQAAVLAEPGDGAFHHPAIDAQATAVRGATPGQERDNAPVPQFASMGLGVKGAIPQNRLGTPPGSPHFARDGRDRIDQRQQLRNVVAVGRRDLGGPGDSVGRGQDMVLGALLAPIRRIGAGLGPPKRRGWHSSRPQRGKSRFGRLPATR